MLDFEGDEKSPKDGIMMYKLNEKVATYCKAHSGFVGSRRCYVGVKRLLFQRTEEFHQRLRTVLLALKGRPFEDHKKELVCAAFHCSSCCRNEAAAETLFCSEFVALVLMLMELLPNHVRAAVQGGSVEEQLYRGVETKIAMAHPSWAEVEEELDANIERREQRLTWPPNEYLPGDLSELKSLPCCCGLCWGCHCCGCRGTPLMTSALHSRMRGAVWLIPSRAS